MKISVISTTRRSHVAVVIILHSGAHALPVDVYNSNAMSFTVGARVPMSSLARVPFGRGTRVCSPLSLGTLQFVVGNLLFFAGICMREGYISVSNYTCFLSIPAYECLPYGLLQTNTRRHRYVGRADKSISWCVAVEGEGGAETGHAFEGQATANANGVDAASGCKQPCGDVAIIRCLAPWVFKRVQQHAYSALWPKSSALRGALYHCAGD